MFDYRALKALDWGLILAKCLLFHEQPVNVSGDSIHSLLVFSWVCDVTGAADVCFRHRAML